MSILSGLEIIRQISLGNILIDPFQMEFVGPNSVDLHLGNRLLVYANPDPLDPRLENRTEEILIPEEGYLLDPNVLYLGSTMEYTATHGFVPYLDGRSSTGRLGISIHQTAGRGDSGFCGHWTCEITVKHPVRIYAGLRLFQITYHTIEGEQTPYRGRYQGDRQPVASRMWKG